MFDVCTRCAHREVCAYKQDFLGIIKAAENAAVTRDMPDGEIASKKVIHYDFIREIAVGCLMETWRQIPSEPQT